MPKHLLHAGFALALIGLALGKAAVPFGWSPASHELVMAEGDRAEVDANTVLYLDKFEVERYPSGKISQYVSTVKALDRKSQKLMPAVIIGPTVAIIGLSLAGNAVGDLQKASYDTASVYVCLIVGLVTLAVTMLCSVYGKGFIKQKDMALTGIFVGIVGLVLGYIILIFAGKAGLFV